MKFVGTPTYDTANTYPPDVTFAFGDDGSVSIKLEGPSREIVLSKADWLTLMRASGPVAAAEIRPASVKEPYHGGDDDCG